MNVDLEMLSAVAYRVHADTEVRRQYGRISRLLSFDSASKATNNGNDKGQGTPVTVSVSTVAVGVGNNGGSDTASTPETGHMGMGGTEQVHRHRDGYASVPDVRGICSLPHVPRKTRLPATAHACDWVHIDDADFEACLNLFAQRY